MSRSRKLRVSRKRNKKREGMAPNKRGERDEATKKTRDKKAKGKTQFLDPPTFSKNLFLISFVSIKMTLMTFWGLNSPQCWVWWYIYANYMRCRRLGYGTLSEPSVDPLPFGFSVPAACGGFVPELHLERRYLWQVMPSLIRPLAI